MQKILKIIGLLKKLFEKTSVKTTNVEVSGNNNSFNNCGFYQERKDK